MTGMQRDSVVQQSHKTDLTLHAASLLLNPNRSLDSSALMTDLGLMLGSNYYVKRIPSSVMVMRRRL